MADAAARAAGRALLVTSGDPAGIGPEVILKTVRRRLPYRWPVWVVGDGAVYEGLSRRLRLRLPAWQRVQPGQIPPAGARLAFIDLGSSARIAPGRSSAAAGAASLAYLECALSYWRLGVAAALITAPVTKWAIDRVRRGFTGQTEYLAAAMRAEPVAMMFVADRMRVVLLSRHVALRDVSRLVTRSSMAATLRVVGEALRQRFKIRRPTLAFCGLNPHAGEGGLFGDEERRVLRPVMRRLTAEGLRCVGPFAADGYFASPVAADVVVAWYHDQGLIPFKMASRDRGCQLTVGLPIIRTSPDHGSGLDIAGRGVAHAGSMRYAMDLAATLSAVA